jgi:hypothetical protein
MMPIVVSGWLIVAASSAILAGATVTYFILPKRDGRRPAPISVAITVAACGVLVGALVAGLPVVIVLPIWVVISTAVLVAYGRANRR